MKKCPYCGEEIQDEAKKCKHCFEWLDKEKDKTKNKLKSKKVLWVIFFVLVASLFLFNKDISKLLSFGKIGLESEKVLDVEEKNDLLDNDKKEQAGKFFDEGIEYSDLGEYSEAIKSYSKAIELDDKFVEAYYNRGTVYIGLGKYSQSIKDYSKAIELDDKFVMAYNNRGASYTSLGNYSQSIKDYSKAIELDDKNANAYYNRGFVYKELGKYSLFEKDMERYKKYGGELR